jgi:hypothetical protein
MDCISEKDLPRSYQSADNASLRAQKKYLVLFRGLLAATCLSALAGWGSSAFESGKLLLSCCATALMVVALALTYVLQERSYEQVWYLGRAVAESIKTRSWCYMTCSAPYTRDLPDPEARKLFLEDVHRILLERGPVTFSSSDALSATEITPAMERLRGSPLEQRLAVYVQCRIVDQKNWYQAKSATSGKAEERAFLAMQICQILAILLGIFFIYKNQTTGGVVGVLAALSSSLLAWLQVRKYQETAQAYSIASQELGSAAELSGSVVSEAQLSNFVLDSESAISREHTLWAARRTMR